MPASRSLFCYGSLQLPVVMKAVTGRDFSGLPAQLEGYTMFRIRNAEYPGIVRQAGISVSGVVYHNLTTDDFRALDAFEGDQYRRGRVSVLLENGAACEAWVYIVRDDRLDELTGEPWTLQNFMEKDFDRFIARFVEGRRDIFEQD